MSIEKSYATEPVWKLIFKLALPAVFMTLVVTLYNMADMIFIAQTGDPNQIAAVSLASPVFLLEMALGTLIGGGACALISTALGAGDRKKLREASSGAMLLTLASSLLLMLGVTVFSGPLARLLGADEATVGHTSQYLFWLGLGALPTVFSTGFANVARAEGAVKQALAANMAGTVTNMVLDPLFISGLGLGVRGAAIATVLGNVLSSALLWRYLTRKSAALTLSLRPALNRPALMGRLVTVGLAGAVTNLLAAFSGVFTNHVWMQYGPAVISAANIAGKATLLCCMVVMGIAIGVQPLMSFAYGSGDRARLREIFQKTGLLTVFVGTALTAACFFFRGTLVGLFTDEPELSALALHILPIGLVSMPLDGLYYLGLYAMQAMERAAPATLLAVARQGAVLLPVFFLLHALFGLEGLYWAAPVADLLSAALAVFLLVNGRASAAPAS